MLCQSEPPQNIISTNKSLIWEGTEETHNIAFVFLSLINHLGVWTIREQIMSGAAQHAYPAEATKEKCWMDPQRGSPQRPTETLKEQRIFPLGHLGKATDTIIIVSRWVDTKSWKWSGMSFKTHNFKQFICSNFQPICPFSITAYSKCTACAAEYTFTLAIS